MEAFFAALTPPQREQFLNGPALAPPQGVVPNFSNPPNRKSLCAAVSIATITVSAVVVSIRVYTRLFCVKKWRLQDYLTVIVLGFFAWFTYVAITCYSTSSAFIHQWDIQLKNLPHLLKGINTANILYSIIMLLLKVCILLDWMQIFTPSQALRGKFYWACIANIIINALFYLAYMFIKIFACNPREKIWNFFVPGKCIDVYKVDVAASVFNFVLDIIMLAMPHFIIWKLGFSKKKKLAVSSIFAMGTFGCVCGAFKILYSIRFMKSEDKSYNIGPFALLAQGEMMAGFVVLCFPSLPKLIKTAPALQRIFSSNKSKPNSRLGLPSWIRVQGQGSPLRRASGGTDWSENEDESPISRSDESQLSPVTVSEKSIAQSEKRDIYHAL